MPLVTSGSAEVSGLLGVESIEDVVIEGVVYDPQGSMVIINGSVLRKGEEQGSVKIVDISKDGAMVSVNGVEAFKSIYSEDNNAEK